MALFKKKQSTTTNIPELQEYYANQKKESTGKAWLLAIGSLLVTVVILVGAFFGGRWLYRKATKKDKPVATISQTTTSSSGKASTSTTSTSTPSSTSTTTTTPTTTPTTPTTSSTTTTTTPAQGVSTTQTASTNTAAAAATTATNPSHITNTGPGNTIGLFAAVTAGAYVAHRRYTLRKLSK